MRRILLLAVALILVSGFPACSSSNTFVEQLGRTIAPYQIVDLNTGTIEPRAEVGDLATNSEYRITKMVFRASPATGMTRSAQRFTPEGDEPAAVASPRTYVAVFEVTQAQWMLMAGVGAAQAVGKPWELVPTTVVSATAYAAPNTGPAYAITLDNAQNTITATNARLGVHLDLPSNGQWEAACRAGNKGSFCWGNTVAPAIPAVPLPDTYAVVAETAPGIQGPLVVGSKAANTYGFFDMHGNVWEWTKEGQIRGGSWRDTLAQSRSGNRVTIDPATPHALVGLRLILIP